jgi:hypothetical protein
LALWAAPPPTASCSTCAADRGRRRRPTLAQLYNRQLAGYWAPQRRIVDDHYRDITPPFRHVERQAPPPRSARR